MDYDIGDNEMETLLEENYDAFLNHYEKELEEHFLDKILCNSTLMIFLLSNEFKSIKLLKDRNNSVILECIKEIPAKGILFSDLKDEYRNCEITAVKTSGILSTYRILTRYRFKREKQKDITTVKEFLNLSDENLDI